VWKREALFFSIYFVAILWKKTLKKCWYVIESRIQLILTNTVLLSVSSLIDVLLLKVRSLSRVAKIDVSERCTGVC